MNIAQIYDILWLDRLTSSYVFAVLPTQALKFINATDVVESCYIINVSTSNSSIRNTTQRNQIFHSPDIINVINDGTRTAGLCTGHGFEVGAELGAEPRVGHGVGSGFGPGTSPGTGPGAGSGEPGDSGGHWLTIIMSHHKLEIFDSLGRFEPGTYGEEMRCLLRKFKCHYVNCELLSTTKCGFFAILYAYYRSRKFTIEYTLNELRMKADCIEKHCYAIFEDRTAV